MVMRTGDDDVCEILLEKLGGVEKPPTVDECIIQHAIRMMKRRELFMVEVRSDGMIIAQLKM